jgi:hypothetical protein
MGEEMMPRQRGAVCVSTWGIAPGQGEAIPRNPVCEVRLCDRTLQNVN